MAKVDKLIVTNRAALGAKYGTRIAAIDTAVAKLVAADKARGLTTTTVDLADPAAMTALGATAVSGPKNQRQNKVAVDAVYRRLAPDYLLILGAPDVVPHQHLDNPTGDEDADVPSDLPYACDRPYSRKISDFLGPTRVVGRIPDLQKAKTDPAYLVSLIGSAAGYVSRPRADYDAFLGITAKVWSASTALSLRNIFGASTGMQTAPAAGPAWTTAQQSRRSHFVNCHGAPADFHFFGEPGFKPSHESPRLAGRLSNGTVIAAECCYGAELYDPAATGGTLAICYEYLRSGAYGVFGSTNIAYGPASGNGEADVITQDFLKHMLAGASLGRAALQARQDYVLKTAVMAPTDLKTIAQFSLLGDPAVQPVKSAPHGRTTAKAGGAAGAAGADRAARRDALLRNGLALGRAASYVEATPVNLAKNAASNARRRLTAALGDVQEIVVFQTLQVVAPTAGALAGRKAAFAERPAPQRVHFALGRRRIKQAPIAQYVAALVRETGGVMGVTITLFSR